MFLKHPKYNSSFAPGFTTKELNNEISRQRKNTRFKQTFEDSIETYKLFSVLLNSRIFSLTADLIFQFFVGEAWGERRIMFRKLKEINMLYLAVMWLSCAGQGFQTRFLKGNPNRIAHQWRGAI